MTHQNSIECAHLFEYLLGELSDRERLAFEAHTKGCITCHEELDAIQQVHDRLNEDDIDTPNAKWFAEHKKTFLQPALSKRSSLSTKSKNDRSWRILNIVHRPHQKALWSSVISIMLIIGVGFVSFSLNAKTVNSNPPVSFINKVSLLPNRIYPNAHGEALFVNNHNQANLILYVNNVPEQSKWGCYDVWGVKGGKRSSLGEFTVDHSGNGALSVRLLTGQKYDAIDVTLEPNWGDDKPQGPQVLAGSWVKI